MFEILVLEHADMIEAYLRSLLRAHEPIDDLLQEVMLVAWRRLDDYDRSRPLAAWLRGIAQILVMEHARKSRRRPLTTDPAVLAELDRRFDAIALRQGDTFTQKTEQLGACINDLPEPMREAIELVYSRNLTIVAAANSVDTNVETLKKRVQRARQLLAECLGLASSAPREAHS